MGSGGDMAAATWPGQLKMQPTADGCCAAVTSMHRMQAEHSKAQQHPPCTHVDCVAQCHGVAVLLQLRLQLVQLLLVLQGGILEGFAMVGNSAWLPAANIGCAHVPPVVLTCAARSSSVMYVCRQCDGQFRQGRAAATV